MSNDLIQAEAKRKLDELLAAKAGGSSTGLIRQLEHVLVSIDSSISMDTHWGNSTRIDAAKVAAREMVNASDPKVTAYTITSFGSEAHLHSPRSTNYIIAHAGIMEIGNGGGTSFQAALELARKRHAISPVHRMIALTDGQFWCSDSELQFFVSNHIKIDTVAIGEANDSLLMHISEFTGGKYHRAQTPEELREQLKALETRAYLQLEHKS